MVDTLGSEGILQTQVRAATSKGRSTSEFQGKVAVQCLLIATVVLRQFGFDDIALDEATAIQIIAGLEAAYGVGRSVVKATAVKAAKPT